jgi:ankyrin repeat protein
MATKLQRSLLAAVKRDDIITVRHLLSQGCDPDFSDSRGMTPLHAAISIHNMTVIKMLVKAGANVDRTVVDRDLKGANLLSPLDLAIRIGDADIIKYLKEKKARTGKKINLDEGRDEEGWPLWMNEKYPDKVPDAKKSKTPPSPEAAFDPDKPVFTADNLKDVFAAAKWTGKTGEMQELWEQVPKKLKKKFDFAASLIEARRNTINSNANVKKLGAPKSPPPDTPAA